jgi:hypothetical protein
MSDEAIDEAIFSALSEIPGHWRKIAFVVGRVASKMGDGLRTETQATKLLLDASSLL